MGSIVVGYDTGAFLLVAGSSRLVGDHHGREYLVPGLVVAGDSEPDRVRMGLWPGEFSHMRKVSAQVLEPAAMFSAAIPVWMPEIRDPNEPATLWSMMPVSAMALACRSATLVSSGSITSIAAPAASGWSGRRVGLAPTGKRRLVTAHTKSRLWRPAPHLYFSEPIYPNPLIAGDKRMLKTFAFLKFFGCPTNADGTIIKYRHVFRIWCLRR
jgi:hypothetical protein